MLFGAFGHIFLAYGLYYGVLVSDFTSYISQSKLFDGQRLKGADGRVFVASGCCSLCDQHIDDGGNEMDGTAAATGNVLKDVIKLQCGHAFHEVCMRGWVIVGKQEVCPACGERVSRRQILLNPWDKPGLVWLNVLVLPPPHPPHTCCSSLLHESVSHLRPLLPSCSPTRAGHDAVDRCLQPHSRAVPHGSPQIIWQRPNGSGGSFALASATAASPR